MKKIKKIKKMGIFYQPFFKKCYIIIKKIQQFVEFFLFGLKTGIGELLWWLVQKATIQRCLKLTYFSLMVGDCFHFLCFDC